MGELQDRYVSWLDLANSADAHQVLCTWEFTPCMVGDEVAGIAMLKGTEVHFAVAPAWRGRLMTRQRIRDFLQPLMTLHGFLTTRSFTEDGDTAVFLTRLGFVKTWTERHIDHWMLTALPYSRGR